MANHLAHENSLYLRQHADNPVDWYPWSNAAIEKAKREDKPILLSIGYSACHWCHVMAQESFADDETAKLMNELFVNIKVDREERPDLDKIYQTTHQLLTGRGGGWPLTVFLNPENLIPFFAGTYFAPRAGLGTPSFKEVLKKVALYYHENKSAITEQNSKVQDALNQLVEAKQNSKEAITGKPLLLARKQLAADFDPIYAGFGFAPKFPQPMNIEFLMKWWVDSKHQSHEDNIALTMVENTLVNMAEGGIYDQIGGGFYRYSVDAAWQIPHFEKMLYDNGLLLSLYAQAIKIEGNELFKTVAQETADWVLREMQSPEGGFYSTIDADSEHHEGKFYYWDRDEVKELLTDEEFKVAELYFGLDKQPNFENHWHLHIAADPKKLTKQLNLDQKSFNKIVNAIKLKLAKLRESRVRPGRDEKIIAAWNGLMIKGLALAGLYLNQKVFINAAKSALDFIHKKLWIDNRLFANFQKGKTQQKAYLDDYAFLLDAILNLLQVNWRTEDLNFAIALADNLLNYFEDKEHGGFFFAASDHEQLIQRPKPLSDEAIPSGNGIAALALIRLGHLLGEARYLTAAEKTLRMAWGSMLSYPSAHISLLQALEEFLYLPQMIILRGPAKLLPKWQQACQEHYEPRRLVFAIPETETHLPGILKQQAGQENKVIAYVCSGSKCLAPIDDFAKLEALLQQ